MEDQEKIQKLQEKDAEYFYQLYTIALGRFDNEKARYYIETRAALDTTNAAWQFDAGHYLDRQNQHQKAIAYYDKALKIFRRQVQENPQAYEPDMAMTIYNCGLLNLIQEKYAEAIPLFEIALNIYRHLAQNNPAQQQWYVGSLYFLSTLYPTVGNNTSAYFINQEFLPYLLKRYEEDKDALRHVYARTLGGQSFYALFMNKFVEAEKYAREGLGVDSTQHFIYTNLAAALLFQGKYAEAEAIYQQYKDEMKNSFLDDIRDSQKQR